MRERQTTSDVLMIRPAAFGSNEQTAQSNRFQRHANEQHPQQLALTEFDALVNSLRLAGVRVHLFEDTPEPRKPDALFPNNWVSFHADGSAILYPMLAENRRLERRPDILDALGTQAHFDVRQIIDLSYHETAGQYLEGTGSMVLDRANRVAYACISPRTHVSVLKEFAQCMNYDAVEFRAHDRNGIPIYHTNVLMSIGARFAAVCTDSIHAEDRHRVLARLRSSHHEVIELSLDQMDAFAGNMLELETSRGELLIALSRRAEQSLSSEQRAQLVDCSGAVVSVPIPTIETLGGGSVRCMLAEIHLPRKEGL